MKGMSQRQAYLNAFPNSRKWKEATVDNKAYMLLKKDEILARYKELQEKAKDEAIIQSKEIQQILQKIIKREEEELETIILDDGSTRNIKKSAKLDTILKAVQELNKMQGNNLDRLEVRDSREHSKLDKILEQLNGEE